MGGRRHGSFLLCCVHPHCWPLRRHQRRDRRRHQVQDPHRPVDDRHLLVHLPHRLHHPHVRCQGRLRRCRHPDGLRRHQRQEQGPQGRPRQLSAHASSSDPTTVPWLSHHSICSCRKLARENMRLEHFA